MIDESRPSAAVVAAGVKSKDAAALGGLWQRMDKKKQELEEQLAIGGMVDNLQVLGSIEAPSSDQLLNVLAQRAQELLAGTLEEGLVQPSIVRLKIKQEEAAKSGKVVLAEQCQHLLSILENPEQFQNSWQQRQKKVAVSA